MQIVTVEAVMTERVEWGQDRTAESERAQQRWLGCRDRSIVGRGFGGGDGGIAVVVVLACGPSRHRIREAAAAVLTAVVGAEVERDAWVLDERAGSTVQRRSGSTDQS